MQRFQSGLVFKAHRLCGVGGGPVEGVADPLEYARGGARVSLRLQDHRLARQRLFERLGFTVLRSRPWHYMYVYVVPTLALYVYVGGPRVAPFRLWHYASVALHTRFPFHTATAVLQDHRHARQRLFERLGF